MSEPISYSRVDGYTLVLGVLEVKSEIINLTAAVGVEGEEKSTVSISIGIGEVFKGNDKGVGKHWAEEGIEVKVRV